MKYKGTFEWEEEFDKKFPYFGFDNAENEFTGHLIKAYIKEHFISKEEVRGIAEKLKREIRKEGVFLEHRNELNDAYNEDLEDLLNKLDLK